MSKSLKIVKISEEDDILISVDSPKSVKHHFVKIESIRQIETTQNQERNTR